MYKTVTLSDVLLIIFDFQPLNWVLNVFSVAQTQVSCSAATFIQKELLKNSLIHLTGHFRIHFCCGLNKELQRWCFFCPPWYLVSVSLLASEHLMNTTFISFENRSEEQTTTQHSCTASASSPLNLWLQTLSYHWPLTKVFSPYKVKNNLQTNFTLEFHSAMS